MAETERMADRPPLRALDPPMLPFAVGGTLIWALLGLVALVLRDGLAAAGHGTWLKICWYGVLVGIPGIAMMYIHDRNRSRRRATKTD